MQIDTLNIVLADDDLDDQFLFKMAIEESDVNSNLLIFNNGKEIMDHLLNVNNDLPDVVFLDLNMPIKDGLQCLKEIRSTDRLKNLSVAIYSTSNSQRDIDRTFATGANVYIHKPSSFEGIKKAFKKVLEINWQYATSNLNKDTFLLKIWSPFIF